MPSNLTTIPAPRVPLISADTGLISTEWYRFLFNLYTLSGSGSNTITLDELQIGPPAQPTTTTGGGGSGTVTSVATGTGLSGGPITSTGTINFAVAAVGTWAATPSSANLLAAMTDETGTGSLVFATSPTLVTPILGTPISGDFSTGTFTWPTFNQNTTGYAASLAGGLAGSLPYQSALNTTTFLAAGTNGQVLTLAAGLPSWATPTTGTVTSVSGTGSVNGITLTGTVTSSGSLTLGGTLGSIANSQLTNSSVTFNGVAVALGASGTITATATNALTIGTGLSGTSYNGSTAVTIANTGVLSVTGTAPVVSSGGQNPAISMAAANTTTNGYLTSTDWNTFNGKGSGSVTSVAATVPAFLSVSGSPITTSGTLAFTYSGTALPVANGGTGQISYTDGQLLIGNTTGNTLTKTTLTAGTGISITNGAGSISIASSVTPVTSVTGTAPVVSSGGTTPAISMAAATTSVNGYLTSTDWTTFNGKQAALVSGTNIKTVGGNSLLGSGDVGTIGIAYGGTGQTTASAAFNALSPITTTGDLILGNGTNSATRLAIGTNTYVLTSNGTTASWQAPAAGGSNITTLGMWENKKIISSNYTIGTGNSAMSAGPITINSGVSVTVPSGSRWVVL